MGNRYTKTECRTKFMYQSNSKNNMAKVSLERKTVSINHTYRADDRIVHICHYFGIA